MLQDLLDNGIEILRIKVKKMSLEEAEKLYEMHKGKDFYEALLKYVTSDKVVLMKAYGKNIVKRVREVIGATDPSKAKEGTIRRKYGIGLKDGIIYNAIHAADSIENAEREAKIFFEY